MRNPLGLAKIVKNAKHRILVTGSRGKSSLVRLLLAGLLASGIDARGRITGVIPRELGPQGEKRIIRNSPAHIEEMRWWLKHLPPGVEAVVMENSAIAPDLQHMAATWLSPTLTIWTNARPDHEDAWGPGHKSAADALARGIPDGGTLLLGAEIANSAYIRGLFETRSGDIVGMADDGRDYRASNLSLAIRAMEIIGLPGEAALDAMKNLRPDVADFRIFTLHDNSLPNLARSACLASAFSANDLRSAEMLFDLTGWREDETSVLYSGRADRSARLKSFEPFLSRPWREVRLIGEKDSAHDVEEWILGGCGHCENGKKVFGCGNVKGAPLELITSLEDRERPC